MNASTEHDRAPRLDARRSAPVEPILTGHRAVGASAGASDTHMIDDELAALARGMSVARRMLGDRFDPALVANPGLDIMLFLFAEGVGGRAVTTNACCAAASVPRTTALRWIKLMADRGLVSSCGDAADRRVTKLSLTAEGLTSMRHWLDQVRVMPLRHKDAPPR